MNFAPIVLFVYKRPSHTFKTLEALSKNFDGEHSDLFIYSDAEKSTEDHKLIQEVREIIRKPWGFKSVTIVEQSKNLGLAQSVIRGVSEVIQKYGRAIVLEDDLVTAPTFLRFMNEALDKYETQKNIFSISGYSFPIPSADLKKRGLYLFQRTSSWGWGTWIDRWHTVDFSVTDYSLFASNTQRQMNFNKGGEDLSLLLEKQMRGEIDSWSIRFDYACFKNQGYCLYPSTSKVLNIGVDGSGTHFKTSSNEYNVSLDHHFSWSWPERLEPSIEVEKICHQYFSSSYQTIHFRIRSFIKKILINIRYIWSP